MIRAGGRGSALAADAATRALAHKARINGMDAPIKIAATDRQGRDFAPIPIETIRRIMDGGEVRYTKTLTTPYDLSRGRITYRYK